MSTKCSYLYGKNFHFYFDYMDYKYHLELEDKEINIPVDFKDTLIELYHIMSYERNKRLSINKIEKIEKSIRNQD